MITASTGAGNSSASSAGHGSSGPAATRAAKEVIASSATNPSQVASGPVHPVTVAASNGVAASCGRYQARAAARASRSRTVPAPVAVRLSSRAPRRSGAAGKSASGPRACAPAVADRANQRGAVRQASATLRHRGGAGSASQTS